MDDLENIDDDLDKLGIPFVKIDDDSIAKDFGILDELPALVYFEDEIPSVYEGDLHNEEKALKWIVKQAQEDTIEEVTEEMLDYLVKDKEYVLVFYGENALTLRHEQLQLSSGSISIKRCQRTQAFDCVHTSCSP